MMFSVHRLGVAKSVWVLVLGSVAALSAHASLSGYTSASAFDAAIAGFTNVQTVDFESIPVGTTFASGTGTGGITFSYSISDGSQVVVGNMFDTTSGTQFIGLDNGNQAFYSGDSLSVNFDHTVHAVGLYVITGGGVSGGDFQLSAPGGSVVNDAVPNLTLGDGSTAYYLGLVESNPAAGFNSVTLSSNSDPSLFIAFNVDDIKSGVLAVPEPSAWSLLTLGLFALGATRGTRRACC